MSGRIWTPFPLVQDGTIYIIGGGPSVKQQDLSLIHSKRVIGVNNAYLLGDWVDYCWFGDLGWFLWHKERLASYTGLIFSCHYNVNKLDGVLILPRHEQIRKGIVSKEGKVAWNGNSGASSINLAYWLGAKRIVLLGFDMQDGPKGESHWHEGHTKDKEAYYGKLGKVNVSTKKPSAPFHSFLNSFPQIAKDAKDLGIEIVNTSMNSQISCFPKLALEQVV